MISICWADSKGVNGAKCCITKGSGGYSRIIWVRSNDYHYEWKSTYVTADIPYSEIPWLPLPDTHTMEQAQQVVEIILRME